MLLKCSRDLTYKVHALKKHLIFRTPLVKLVLAIGAGCATDVAYGHHSYASYDLSSSKSVAGTVAKLEWSNPHIHLWLYVPGGKGGGYELWSFESGSVAMLKRYGWTAKTLQPGEKITVEYFPSRDSKNSGYFAKAIHADGRIENTDPHAPGGEQFTPPTGDTPK
jgi:hypothetical protein